ncbi:unnamed protein product [Alopecurus aequalis]
MAYSPGFLVAILACACALSALAARDLAEDHSIVARHEQWMSRYRRVYSDDAEKARRLDVFKANVAFIESVNSGTDKFWLEANQFADISEDEFRATYTGYKAPVGGKKGKTTGFKYANVSLDALPASVDWRTKGAVTPIKDQGQCGYEDVPANDEASLQKAVAAQPVSIGLDGGDNLFRFYKGGILSGDCGTELDHSIVAVGYGMASDGTKYWVMKNSWGTSWGEKGFIRMEREEQGLCGLAMQPSYPTA